VTGQPTSPEQRAWSLWRDWCEATGRASEHADEATLAAFAAQVRGPSLKTLVRAATAVGLDWPGAEPPAAPSDPWEAPERSWMPTPAALARCPVYGWPMGARGRRDAWLIVLTRVLRLTRREAVAVDPDDLPDLWDRIPAPATAEEPCLRCVAARWLDVAATADQWSRSSVRQRVWPTSGRNTWQGSDRPCDGSCEQPLPPFSTGWVLAPAIDQHGWWTDWRPMSTRTLTAILAVRCDPLFVDLSPEPGTPLHDEDLGPARRFDETTFERLEAACANADEVNERMRRILDDVSLQVGI
jgi:hypothetical protein